MGSRLNSFSNENNQLITQRVRYDWTPVWCTKCAQFGHEIGSCRMGPKPGLLVDEHGFRPMRKAKSTGGIKKHTHIPPEPNADPMEHNKVPPVPGASVPMIPAVVEVPTDQEVPPVDSTGPGSSPSRLAPSLISLS